MSHTKTQDQRDMNPHKHARFAMWLWSPRYAKSGLGSMVFWDSLSEGDRNLCREAVAQLEAARDETDDEKETKP